ncbi:hypothetical protein B8B80_21300 [Pseudomonas aeruginosa]|uniref:DUF2188 domain-containing protein n=1 Tax=Pseudomonas aeruginosa TaxID=287 RepID=A0A509JJE6_PSEAI|nr:MULTISPECIES: hypothetical protein [Pseudomonas]EQL39174.1 hypothetical protein M770_24390 [Pseudomonas aeruginosa VRFPA03]AON72472.1 hypothetical protein BG483_15160 [Pseudomonas aeruginosa]ASP03973.1 hypothetical protein CGU46_03540 [Pseudomonas aeruginosa]ASP14123.1 hypothetical protein CGU45_23280 [Pseudomonas aeruginosa]AVZ32796.1 hypothetical protein B8B76_05635 [Pseudomonas aeruginosa]
MQLRMHPSTKGGWIVQVGAYRISFHTEREGREYLRKLRERIEAPHALPGSPKPRIIRQAR